MKKRHLLKINLLVLLYLISMMLVSSVQAAGTRENFYKDKQKSAQYCFMQSADEVKIVPHAKEDNTFTLTLKKVVPYVTYFSDRPHRDIGSMAITEFIKFWERDKNNSFKENPPNAGLNGIQEGFLSSNKSLNFIFELTNPHYDPQTKDLTYTAKLLKDPLTPLSKSSITLQHVNIFIDDVCLSCWGG